MEDCFGISLNLSQDGQCLLFGDDAEMFGRAKAAVMDLVADVEAGGVYEGTVISIKDFGMIIGKCLIVCRVCVYSTLQFKIDSKVILR